MTFDDDPLEQAERRDVLAERRTVPDRRATADERFASSATRRRALDVVGSVLASEPEFAHLTPARRDDLGRRIVRLMADLGLPV